MNQLRGESAEQLLPPFANGLPSPSKFFRLDQSSSPMSSTSSSSSASSFSPVSSSSSVSSFSPNTPSKSTYNPIDRHDQGGNPHAQYASPSSNGGSRVGGYSRNKEILKPTSGGLQYSRPTQSFGVADNLYTPNSIDPYSKMSAIGPKAMNDPDQLAAPFLTDASFIPGKSQNSKPSLPARPEEVRDKNKNNGDTSSLSQIFFKNMKGNPAAAVLPNGGFKKEFDNSLLGGSGSYADAMVAGEGNSRNDYDFPTYGDIGEEAAPKYDYSYADDNQNAPSSKNGNTRQDFYDNYDYPTQYGNNYDYDYDYDDSGYVDQSVANPSNYTNYKSSDYKNSDKTPENFERGTTKSFHIGKSANDEVDKRYADSSRNRNYDYNDYSPEEGKSREDYYNYDYPSDDYYSNGAHYSDRDSYNEKDKVNTVNDRSNNFDPATTEYNPYAISSAPHNENTQDRVKQSPTFYEASEDNYRNPSDNRGETNTVSYPDSSYIANEYGISGKKEHDYDYNDGKGGHGLGYDSVSGNRHNIPVGNSYDDTRSDENSYYANNDLVTNPTERYNEDDNSLFKSGDGKTQFVDSAPPISGGSSDTIGVLSNLQKPFIGPTVSKTNLLIEPIDSSPLVILPTSSSGKKTIVSKPRQPSGPLPFRRPK